MKIEVNIIAPELVDAINNLSAALGSAPKVAEKSEAKKTVDDKKEQKSEKESKKSDKKADKPKEDKSKKDSTKSEEKEADVPKPEDVRAKAAEVAKAGKRDEVKELLAEMGAKTVTAIPEDKRAEFIEKLDQL